MRAQLGRKQFIPNIRLVQKSPFPGFIAADNTAVCRLYSDMEDARKAAREMSLACNIKALLEAAKEEEKTFTDLEVLDADE